MRTKFGMVDALRAGLWCCGWLSLVAVGGCASDDEETPVVGSGNVTDVTTDVQTVEVATIDLRFETEIYDGDPGAILLRGEDNLLDFITVEEVAVGEYEISAPVDFEFEQHDPIEVYIPFLEMVRLDTFGDNITVVDTF